MMVSVEGLDDGESDDVILDGEDEGVGEGSGGGEVNIVGNNPISTPVYPFVSLLMLLKTLLFREDKSSSYVTTKLLPSGLLRANAMK
ncbi:hypothetical protein Tco_0712363 [Tanacetum coccineum]